jgi:hypothetical protein
VVVAAVVVVVAVAGVDVVAGVCVVCVDVLVLVVLTGFTVLFDPLHGQEGETVPSLHNC